MKNILFIIFAITTNTILPSEFQNTINKKDLKKQINDFFEIFIAQRKTENPSINSFIKNNQDDFETYVDIYKTRTRNKVFDQSNKLGFSFERILLEPIINVLYRQAEAIDHTNNNSLIQDFLKEISQLENEF